MSLAEQQEWGRNSQASPRGAGGCARGAEPRLSPQNSTLTIEEFHAKLQEATNFPLRPFVIPFLKVGLQPGHGGIHGSISAQGIWGWLWGCPCAPRHTCVPPGTRVSPPHVWSHTGPGLVAIKQGVSPAGCHLKFIKNSLFFLNLPFNSMLTLQSPHSRGICPVLAMLALPADVCARCPLSLVSKGIIKKCKTLFHLCIPPPRAGVQEWRSTLIAGICGVVCCRLSWSGTAEPPPLLSSLQHFWDARSRER